MFEEIARKRSSRGLRCVLAFDTSPLPERCPDDGEHAFMKKWLLQYYHQHLRPLSLENRERFHLYGILVALAIVVLSGFSGYNFLHGNLLVSFRDAAAAVMLLACLILVIFSRHKMRYYQISIYMITLFLALVLFHGASQSASLLWMYLIPSISFFLLGTRWAIGSILLSYAGIGIVFWNIPIFSFTPFPYPYAIKVRFLVTYLLLIVIASLHETIRNRFRVYAQEEHERLRREIAERKRVEDALKRSQEELEQRVRKRTAELEKAKEQAEVANLSKTNFLSGMSHEFRTPLNHIMGFTQILQSQLADQMNERHRGYFQTILQSSNHLLAMLEDILDLSRIDLGELTFCRGSVNLKHIINQSLATFRGKDVKKHLILTSHLSPEVNDLTIEADERKLKQILFNLLSNAVKFTPDSGKILLTAERQAEEVMICVSDTGIGITPEQQEKLFSNFYQASSGLRGKTPGVGVGLALVKRLVEMHGGRIWVESGGEGKGSRFSFSLPIHVSSPLEGLDGTL